jgi:hypothetical protein
MTTLDFESDQFLQLVTDALRAGPDSPAWRQAVNQLMVQDIDAPSDTSAGASGIDEYKLLFTARQHLESGKGYRQIRAGPKFTQNVMAAVAREAAGKDGAGAKSLPMAMLMFLAAAILILGVVGIGGYFLWGRAAHQTLAQLQSQTFAQDVASATFDGAAPAGWRVIGGWGLRTDDSLHPASEYTAGGYIGCGIVANAPIAPDQPAAIEAKIQLPSSGQTVVQLFVTDQPDFKAQLSTSPHEFVLAIAPPDPDQPNAAEPKIILPDGSFAAFGTAPAHPGEAIVLRLSFNSDFALADVDGQRIYAGPHQLANGKPRFVGARFLCSTGEQPSILSVRVTKG